MMGENLSELLILTAAKLRTRLNSHSLTDDEGLSKLKEENVKLLSDFKTINHRDL